MKQKLQTVHDRFASLWWGDRGLSALLVLLGLLLLSFLMGPVFDSGTASRLRAIFFSMLLLSGFTTMSERRLPTVCAGIVAVAAVILTWLRDFNPASRPLELGSGLVTLCFMILLTVAVIWHVFRDGPVTGGRIQDAIAAYILIGLTWAQIYRLLDAFLPGSINLPPLPPGQAAQAVDSQLTYFSFVTLTTLGYGDITPIHSVARMFAVLEALIGQLFPATLLARLVALETMNRSRGGKP